MRIVLLVATFVIGLLLALHLAMNAAAGRALANPRVGNMAFWISGAIIATILGLSAWRTDTLAAARTLPPWLWLAGALGACLILGIAMLIPELGAGSVMAVLLAAQLLGGMMLSHFGVLGSPVEKINVVRVVGTILMMTGVMLVVRGRI
jgi:transporter family-2 protein